VIGRLVHRYRWAVPYVLMAPGLLWLVAFFVVPMVPMILFSISEGTVNTGIVQPPDVWAIGNYPEVVVKFQDNVRNSLVFGALATTLCFAIGYPLAYAIAFRGGRYKNLLLFLVIAPFFTSFLIRTISWKVILGNDGPFLAVVRDALHLVPANFSVMGTPLAVVSGLTYQLLPFMVLPLYVSLEKVDIRFIEAARDLYAGPWRPRGTAIGAALGGALAIALMVGLRYADPGDPSGLVAAGGAALVGALLGGLVAHFLVTEAFVRVVFPLSLPGVFAASILTFIPAVGDYVNADLLGVSPNNQMIGNVIQNRYLFQTDYPVASALSFILMGAILLAIALYAKVLGTEELTGGRA